MSIAIPQQRAIQIGPRPNTSTTSTRIAVEWRTHQALLGPRQRVRPLQLTVETDQHGDTHAYLEPRSSQGERQ